MSCFQPPRLKALAAKLILSAGALFLGWEVLHLSAQVFVVLRQTEEKRLHPDPLLLQRPARAEPAARATVPWPKFALRAQQDAQECVLNGVRLLSEEWEGPGTPEAVLDFYRGQMQARGWTEETEEALGLSSATLASTANKRALEDPVFLRRYQEIVDSNLILRQGEWSMHVTVRRSGIEPGQVAVHIAAAKVPSLAQFASGVVQGFNSPTRGRQGQPTLEHEESRGGQRYRTVLSTKSGSLDGVFRDALAELARDQWQVLIQSNGERQSRRFAWLVRQDAHLAMCVTPAPGGGGVSLARTEVRPN